MLGKLMKYEWKATAKFFLPLYLVTLILTPITRVITNLEMFKKGPLSVISGTFILTYVLMMFALFIVSFVLVIYRFYKNMVTEEGYLMHTLPVTPAQHIISKLIVAFCWNVISCIVFLLSLFIFFFSPELITDIRNIISELVEGLKLLNTNGVLFIIEMAAMALIGLVHYILYVYVSIAIGQVISRHKLLGAFASAIVINIVSQIITTVLCIPFVVTKMDNPEAISRIMFTQLFPLNILITLVITAAFFFITNYIMKKKLNLE